MKSSLILTVGALLIAGLNLLSRPEVSAKRVAASNPTRNVLQSPSVTQEKLMSQPTTLAEQPPEIEFHSADLNFPESSDSATSEPLPSDPSYSAKITEQDIESRFEEMGANFTEID